MGMNVEPKRAMVRVREAIELEVLPLCEREGLGIMVYNPLAGGLLTGKYKKGADLPKGSRMEAYGLYHDRYYTDQALEVAERFVAYAGELGVSPAQLAFSWVRGDSRVTVPIIGARNMEQITDTIGGLALSLTTEERDAIPSLPPGRWVGIDPVYDRRE